MARSGPLEIRISPVKGEYISKIRKTAAETASAERNRPVTTVKFLGAKRPKLRKAIVSLLGDRERREHLGEAARRVATRLSPAEAAELQIAVYRSLDKSVASGGP